MRDNIKHIFFDLDHTLWDFDKNSKLALAALFSQYGISLELSKFLKVYEPVNYAYWARFRIEQVTKTELRRGRLRDSFAPFGLTFNEVELDAMSETYIDELPKNNHLFSRSASPSRFDRTMKCDENFPSASLSVMYF